MVMDEGHTKISSELKKHKDERQDILSPLSLIVLPPSIFQIYFTMYTSRTVSENIDLHFILYTLDFSFSGGEKPEFKQY